MNNNNPETRKVTIKTERNTHFVCYCDHKKYGRRCAAMFDARDHSIEKVKAWVKSKPGIELND